jgi:hypothetical protein
MRHELGREPAHLPKRPGNQFAEASPAPCGSVADQRGKHEINGRRQFDPGPVGRPGSAAAGISVRHVLKEGSNNGATGPADEHQRAIRGLPLSEDRLSLRETARRMIGS